MADNIKIDAKITFSENTDFSDPEWVTNMDSITGSPVVVYNSKVSAATGGTTITLTPSFTTVLGALVQNTDATNFVTATFRNAAAATVAIKILAGQTLMTPDVDPAVVLTLTADTAACLCKVIIWGT